MSILDVFLGRHGSGGGPACSHWDPDEADRRFGRGRPITGRVYCDDDGCNTPCGPGSKSGETKYFLGLF